MPSIIRLIPSGSSTYKRHGWRKLLLFACLPLVSVASLCILYVRVYLYNIRNLFFTIFNIEFYKNSLGIYYQIWTDEASSLIDWTINNNWIPGLSIRSYLILHNSDHRVYATLEEWPRYLVTFHWGRSRQIPGDKKWSKIFGGILIISLNLSVCLAYLIIQPRTTSPGWHIPQ